MGLFKVNSPQTYPSYVDIPDFGLASHPTAVANPSYLVSSARTAVRVREVPQKAGGVRFAIDPKWNEDTVVFSPGGRHGSNVILYGMVGTVSSSAVSKALYGSFAVPLRKSFRKQHEFYVGPKAFELWQAGFRLTAGAASPLEFDLKK
jgi:hypothetical protein